jgi:hypothetical protein
MFFRRSNAQRSFEVISSPPPAFTAAESARVNLCLAQSQVESTALIEAISTAITALQNKTTNPRTIVAGLPPLATSLMESHKRLRSAMFDRCRDQFAGIYDHVPETAFKQMSLLLEDAVFFAKRNLDTTHIIAALRMAHSALQSLSGACQDLNPEYRDPGYTMPPFESLSERQMKEERVRLCKIHWLAELQKMQARIDIALTMLSTTNEAAGPVLVALGERLQAVKFYYERYGSAYYNQTGRLLYESSVFDFNGTAFRRSKDLLGDLVIAARAKTPRSVLTDSLTALKAQLPRP